MLVERRNRSAHKEHKEDRSKGVTILLSPPEAIFFHSADEYVQLFKGK
jgi:hypothetical protein